MKNDGLHNKFKVERVDGSDAPGGRHNGCEYFVLDMTHDRHAMAAVAAYADACRDAKPELAADLDAKWGGKAAAKLRGAAVDCVIIDELDAVKKREAEGVALFDDLLARERAKVATMTIEIEAMRNRLATHDLSSLRGAIEFLDRCRADREKALETGAFKDAWDWLESAAREVLAREARK